MFGWFRRDRRLSLSLTEVALKLEKAFSVKVISAFKAGEPDLSKEQIGAGLHSDLTLAYISEYVIAVCHGFRHPRGKDQAIATAMVLNSALHYPKDDIVPAIVTVRTRIVAAVDAFDAEEDGSGTALSPETRTLLAVAWKGRENGEQFVERALVGDDSLTAQELLDFSSIALGRFQVAESRP